MDDLLSFSWKNSPSQKNWKLFYFLSDDELFIFAPVFERSYCALAVLVGSEDSWPWRKALS